MTSVYEAENTRRAHQNEDQLTSRVFGALAMLSEETVLLPFLRLLATDDKDDLTLVEMQGWEPSYVTPCHVHLWKRLKDRSPDVYIDTPHTIIVIEVKKDSQPDDRQIIAQYREARVVAQHRRVTYFLLTKDREQPPEISRAQTKLKVGLPDARATGGHGFTLPSGSGT